MFSRFSCLKISVLPKAKLFIHTHTKQSIKQAENAKASQENTVVNIMTL